MSNLVHGLAFGTLKYILPNGEINHGLVNPSSNCDMKLGLRDGKSHFYRCNECYWNLKFQVLIK